MKLTEYRKKNIIFIRGIEMSTEEFYYFCLVAERF